MNCTPADLWIGFWSGVIVGVACITFLYIALHHLTRR